MFFVEISATNYKVGCLNCRPILWKLVMTHDLCSWLVGKPMIDFLLAVIELFSLATGWARKPDCFLKVCNSRVCWHRITFYNVSPKTAPFNFCNNFVKPRSFSVILARVCLNKFSITYFRIFFGNQKTEYLLKICFCTRSAFTSNWQQLQAGLQWIGIRGTRNKIGGAYYRDVVLCKYLLPAICHFDAECYTFQQDSASSHRRPTRDTVELLRRAWDAGLHSTRPVASQQSGPQPRTLPNLGVLQERV